MRLGSWVAKAGSDYRSAGLFLHGSTIAINTILERKGAFKIANSWGTGDWNGGYRWVAYDALRTTSSVPAAGSTCSPMGCSSS